MSTIAKSHQRNYGIDLLRLVAAFYVIILHVVIQGGVFNATTPYTYQNYACRLLLVFSFCAVNIFGIISGYVGYREPPKECSYAGYFPTWLTVVFYCVLITGSYRFIFPETVTREDLAYAFFPVATRQYWYFSAYTLVFFLAPFLNKAIYYASDKENRQLFCIICFFITMVEYIGGGLYMYKGYSAIWLILLYLIGGIMKKTGMCSKLSAPVIMMIIIIINFCLFYLSVKVIYLPFFLFSIDFEVDQSYITPFYLASAILHVALFSRLKFNTLGKKFIGFAAPAAFSVYIANTQPTFWRFYMKNRFTSWGASSPKGIFIRVLAFAAIFVLSVVIIDYFRRKLFLLLRVHKWPQSVALALRKEHTR